MFFGCKPHVQHKKPKHEHIQSYRTHNEDDSWVYWYVIYDNTTRNFYTASSTAPAANYSSLTWTKSDVKPPELEKTEPIEAIEVEIEELGALAEEISADYNSLDSMEGVPDAADSSDDAGSSSDSGDAGGDSGGDAGDSGGGGDSGGE